MRSAVVLAGGHGTRFGDADEATADLDGEPMIRHVVAGVSDPVPDGGPVAGIRTGCRVARGEWTFVTPCDRPFVPTALPQQLFEAADGDGAVPLVGGRPRPLSPVTVADPVPEHAFDEFDTPAARCVPRDRSA
ncbi:MAG: NTP transferase domain-containing protein [Haloarcula sp.]